MAPLVLVAMGLCTCGASAVAADILVAVASNFAAPMRDIATRFEADTGHVARLSTGSSGMFYAQIHTGAPFHVFFSADQARPAALERDGMVVPGSRFTYASGALVLWSRDPGVAVAQARVLREGGYKRLALANPKLAPYGMAAVQVLERLDLVEATRGRWVQGENIAQTYQFVHSGNADVGFVALSQLIATGGLTGSAWPVPAELYSPIRQDAVRLRTGEHNVAAKALMQYLRGAPARDIIQSYGYSTPP